MGWILASGVAHLLGRAVGGKGSFEDMLTVFAFGISIASWSTLVHDLLTSFLGAVHIIDQHQYEITLNTPTFWRSLLWIQMIIYLFWFIILFTKGIRSVHTLKALPATLIGITGFIVYQLFFFIFNR